SVQFRCLCTFPNTSEVSTTNGYHTHRQHRSIRTRNGFPVHVNNTKGDISSGVITFDGKQILGKVDVRNEKSSAGFGGKENMLVGPACANNTIVLCRKARPGYKFD
ncbi:hypothetical protein OSTOST_24031, partial [Ostertagia ostertagi]